MPQKSKYCWDAPLFISILEGEQRANGETEALLEVVDAADRGLATIITSVLALAEVLGDATSPDVRVRFESLFRRPNYLMVSLSPAICTTAADVRSAARAERRRIKTPDATYIATAMAYRCDALHTFDDQLVGISGRPYVNGLRICYPAGEQTVLPI